MQYSLIIMEKIMKLMRFYHMMYLKLNVMTLNFTSYICAPGCILIEQLNVLSHLHTVCIAHCTCILGYIVCVF